MHGFSVFVTAKLIEAYKPINALRVSHSLLFYV